MHVFSDHNTAHWLHLFRLRLHSLHPCRETKTTLAAQPQKRLRLHWLHTCRYIVLVDEATFATPLQKDSGYTVSSLQKDLECTGYTSEQRLKLHCFHTAEKQGPHQCRKTQAQYLYPYTTTKAALVHLWGRKKTSLTTVQCTVYTPAGRHRLQ